MDRFLIFDSGGVGDRYTVIDRMPHAGQIEYFGMNAEPFHPLGIGMHGAIPTPNGDRLARLRDLAHLGKRIKIEDLPTEDARKAARDFIEAPRRGLCASAKGRVDAMDDEEKPQRPSARLIAILVKAYGVHLYGRFRADASTVYVSGISEPGKPGPGYVMWHITDNGGEYIVRPVNEPHLGPRGSDGVPYDDRTGLLDDGTMAYRIAMVIRGDEIDYDLRCRDLIDLFATKEP